jgi:sulfur-oxidizing protein SoxY
MPSTSRHAAERRRLVSDAARVLGLLAASGAWPSAWSQTGPSVPPVPRSVFELKDLGALAQAMGIAMPQASEAVALRAPDVAENGAVVPIEAGCALPGVQRLLLLVERNPNLLAAAYTFVGEAVEPALATRLKLAETTDVVAVALLADGRALYARRAVQVIVGGCG